MRIAFLMILATFALAPITAHAIVDAQVMTGRRWYTIPSDHGDDQTFKAQQFSVGIHFDPIPMIPISLGASYSVYAHDKDDFDSDTSTYSKAEGRELNAEVTLWVPGPKLNPYLKYGKTFRGEMVVAGDDETQEGSDAFEAKANVEGHHIAVGCKFAMSPMVDFSLELSRGQQAYTVVEMDGTEIQDGPETDLNSEAVLAGVQIGI